jgi:murein DD-endopeptidase MepM/ murein hydrolase activator NlpD
MRWIAWSALPIVLLLLLGTGSMVRGEVTTQKRIVSRGRPASATVAMLRTRWPVHGPISSSFGERRGWLGRHVHTGVDIGAHRGTPVHAPAGGTVTFAGWHGAYGRTVVIDHGGNVRSLYGHLSKLDVRAHQRIATGAEIGLTGSSGNASGPHLHYEVLVNGHPVNPRDRAFASAHRASPIRMAAHTPPRRG